MPIQLSEVLFPLRYDVWDQAAALQELSAQHEDLLSMLAPARDSAIFRHVVIADPVYQAIGMMPALEGPEQEYRVEQYFMARLKKLVAYRQSIEQDGWDTSEDRIYFKYVANPTTTSSNNPVPEGLFLANGQHRVIALLSLGETELGSHIADVAVRDGADFLPLDMTGPYIKAGECTEEKFVEFARFRFDVPGYVNDIKGLREWAQTGAPVWLTKYLDVYWGTTA